MKKLSLFLFLLTGLTNNGYSQYTHRIKADSVLLTNDTTSNELIIENESRHTSGFLYNRGNGRTEFRRGIIRLNDSIYLIASDSIIIPSSAFGPNWWQLTGNTNTHAGINQLGTRDSIRHVFRTNNQERATFTANGNFLIGSSANSIFKLDVTGAARVSEDIFINGIRVGKGPGGIVENTAVGYDAMQANTTGVHNTALGYQALYANTSGRINTAIGALSLYSNTTGENNTAVGGYSLTSNVTGGNNTAGGYRSLSFNTSNNNTAVGSYSLHSNTTGAQNVAIGHHALSNSTTGNSNTAVGDSALAGNTTGTGNNAFGKNALQSNTTANNNVALGFSAMQYNSTGIENVAVGNLALRSNTTAAANSAIGHEALNNNTTGTLNTAIGNYSLRSNTTGSYNTSVGYGSLRSNVTGDNNVSAGINAMLSNQSGSFNTASGPSVFSDNTTGSENTASGSNALKSNTSGNGNVSFGYQSLLSKTTGDYNIALGNNAGSDLNSGSGNIFIGYNTQPNISNTSSQQLNIGNWIYGNAGMVGIGVTVPTAKAHLDEGQSGSNLAPLKFASGTLMTTPENGSVEYNGSDFYVTAGSTRYVLAKKLTETATLDFPDTPGGNSNDLTITLTGATEGDPVLIVPPGAAQLSNSSYTAYVSSTNTITVRFNNYSNSALDPASGNFKVVLFKY